MISYHVKTWRCTDCDYAYSGAIPPTMEQNSLVFPGKGLRNMECPACRTVTMERVTDPAKKTVHNCTQQTDIDELAAQLAAAPAEDIRVEGSDVSRVETAAEKRVRIERIVGAMTPITKKDLALQRKHFECDA